MPITLPDFLGGNRLQNIFGALAAPQDNSQVQQTPAPAQPDMLSIIADKLMQPDQNVDAMRSQVGAMPQRSDFQPSIMRRIGAAITGVGYGPKAGADFLDSPFDKAQEDWKNKFGATKIVADEDTKNQRNELGSALKQESISNAKQKATDAQNLNNERAQNALTLAHEKLKAAYDKLESDNTNKQATLDFKNAQLDMIRKYHDLETSLKSAAMDKKGFDTFNIPDPSDSTKQIAVKVDRATGQASRVTLDGEQVGPAAKPGSGSGKGNDVTASTRTMMEGAQMLLPRINSIGAQAADLNNRGLFGPIMSRIRGYAAKIGTTGSPEEVQKSLSDFTAAIDSDPYIRASNDAGVGRFITSLGLLATGAGRVHGGARSGGSITMINHMKDLLSADSTLNMFNGRLMGLTDFMKDYAAGPKAQTKTNLDDAIDAILSGVKK